MEVNLGRVQGKSAYEVAIENGFIGTEADWLTSLKGQQGEKGEQGIQGLKGDKGDTGEQGIQGEKGEPGERGQQGLKGDKGEPFTYEDFTEEQLASLKGEKGDKGDKGEPGDPATYDDTELRNKITEVENSIGDISTILDEINGEVV